MGVEGLVGSLARWDVRGIGLDHVQGFRDLLNATAQLGRTLLAAFDGMHVDALEGLGVAR